MGLRSTGRLAALAAALCALALPAAAAAQTFEFGDTESSPPGALAANASGIAVDADGNVWVTDPDHQRIVKYDYNGSFIAEFPRPIGGGPDFVEPEAIAADASGFLYVVQGNTPEVVKIDSGGSYIATIGPAGFGGTDLVSPTAVAVDSATGEIFVADAARIVIYNPNGVPTGRIPISGPTGVAVFEGEVIAAFAGFAGNEVVRLRRNGTIIDSIPATNFTGSLGEIAVDSEGRIYVTDIGAGVVRRFSRDGSAVEALGTQGLDEDETAEDPQKTNVPNAVALDCRGNIYVVDAGQRTEAHAPASNVVKFGVSTEPPPCTPRPPPPDGLDLQINDIDVFQAVQVNRTYTAGPPPPAGPPLFDLPEPDIRSRPFGLGDTTGFAEVPLRAGAKTIVRVYAALRLGPEGGIANVPMTLEGIAAGGRSLGEIQPTAKPAVVRVGDRTVDPAERSDPAGAYAFTLPEQWTTQGPIDLIARINPAGIGCEGPCRNRSTFRLNGVPFLKTAKVPVVPIALTDGGVYPIPDAHDAFDAARVVTPLDLDIYGFHGQAEVGDIINAPSVDVDNCVIVDLGFNCTTSTYIAGSPRFRKVQQAKLMDRLEDEADRVNVDDCDFVPIGLVEDNLVLPGAMGGEWKNEGLFECALGYAMVSRPVLSVAHELAHAFARPHASNCGVTDDEQEGEDWFPDQRGLLGGIGLDPRTGSGGARGPYRLIATGLVEPPGDVFDMMSYCASEATAWVSPRGWNNVIGFRASEAGAARAGAAAIAGPAGVATSSLRVSATELDDGSLGIAGISPVADPPAGGPADSPYVIEARDAAGALLASIPAAVTVLADGRSRLLSGIVPAPPGTTQVLVWRGTEAGTRVQATASPPKVKLLSPRGGSRVSKRTLAVRWRATDPDGAAGGGPLRATVEYSSGDNKWDPVHTGPAESGSAQIPRSLLAGSKRARVRVRVDDGFGEDVATSGQFAVAPSPPDVRIADPSATLTMPADAPLDLRGEAFGAGGVPLGARALRWADGRRTLGRGEAVTATGLRLGRHKITLSAAQGGLQGRDTLTVKVTPAKPEFLVLAAPAIAAKARKMRLRVASTVAAKLKVGRRSFDVSPRARKVTIPVPKGKGPFELTVKLRAGRLGTQTVLAVERG